MTTRGTRDSDDVPIAGGERHDQEGPRLPMGEYRNRRGPIVAGALLCVLFALIVVVAGVLESDPVTRVEWVRVLATFSLGASPLLAMGGYVAGRLRGGPALEVSEDGLRIQRGGLWTVVPFVPVPEPELLPWSDIVSIEPMPRTDQAVVIRMRGRSERWWDRLLPIETPRGVRLGLSFIEGDPSHVVGDLVGWSEHRLELEVRRDSTALRPGGTPPVALREGGAPAEAQRSGDRPPAPPGRDG